jgi:hypothetical protein
VKENTVQKHTKIEQELNEEQKQAITGGCNVCIDKLAQAATLRATGDTFNGVARMAQQRMQQSATEEGRNFFQEEANNYRQYADANYRRSNTNIVNVLQLGHIRRSET